MKVGVVGGSGYTGAELLRLLCVHPEAEINWVTSRKFVGKPLSAVHPNLRDFTDIKFSQFSDDMVNDCDVVFLCLPHGASMDIVKKIHEKVKVIDLGADFRIKSPETYKKYYSEHSQPDLLKKFVYGLPELHREEIRKASLVANPGCISTSVILGLHPLVQRLKNLRITVDVKIGSSSAGRKASMGSIHAERCGVVRVYSTSNHRHLAEVEQELGIGNIGMTAHAIDMTRGVFSTCHVFPKELPTLRELREIYREFYQNEHFVRVVVRKDPSYNLPDTKTVIYSNFCEVGFAIDEHANRIVVFSALDNMIKGAGGQAIQNMNLMFGLDETTGLKMPGFYL